MRPQPDIPFYRQRRTHCKILIARHTTQAWAAQCPVMPISRNVWNSFDYVSRSSSVTPGERCEGECCQVRRAGRVCSRKRKERNESNSEQDNKFSRSSSLGRPPTPNQQTPRWRSSSLSGSGRGEQGESGHVLHEVQESALLPKVRPLTWIKLICTLL